MAHIWLKSDAEDGLWQPHNLDTDELILAPPLLAPESTSPQEAPRPPRLKCFKGATGPEEWLLIAPPALVRINGTLDQMGFRILNDKDEVKVRGFQSFYFSTERLPLVEKFPAGPDPVHCPRCHDVILADSDAVCCPECHTWHHQRADRECWTYAERCSFCPQPTALSNGYRWQPEPSETA